MFFEDLFYYTLSNDLLKYLLTWPMLIMKMLIFIPPEWIYLHMMIIQYLQKSLYEVLPKFVLHNLIYKTMCKIMYPLLMIM